MGKSAIIEKLEDRQLKQEIPSFRVGDTISVHTLIREGEKERVQVFTGTVIARKGHGLSETFSLHRVAYGEGMERVFLLHSPRIAKIEVMKRGRVRRSKLYYLRGKTGKKARVRGLVGPRKGEQKSGASKKSAEAKAAPAPKADSTSSAKSEATSAE